MSTKQNSNSGCGIAAALGVIASLIAIFTFVTGIVSIKDINKPPLEPTIIIVRETSLVETRPTEIQQPSTVTEPTSVPVLPSKPEPAPTDIVYTSVQKPNTPNNQILNVGETWVKDGFGVTLTKVEPGNPGSRFHFIFENSTNSDIYFDFDTEKITVTDNNGAVYSHSRTCKTPVELHAGKTNYWITTYCPGGDTFQDKLNDLAIQYFLVEINNMGRIDKAVWQVPIPR
jgi:hypothetical protein